MEFTPLNLFIWVKRENWQVNIKGTYAIRTGIFSHLLLDVLWVIFHFLFVSCHSFHWLLYLRGRHGFLLSWVSLLLLVSLADLIFLSMLVMILMRPSTIFHHFRAISITYYLLLMLLRLLLSSQLFCLILLNGSIRSRLLIYTLIIRLRIP
jgi:hypothetical protein